MFDKKEMKLISFEKAKKELLNGVPVFLVKLDGTLVELTEAADWKSVFFHNLKGGNYAVYRKRHRGIKEFHRELTIGKSIFTIEHIREGGGASWRFASYRENR